MVELSQEQTILLQQIRAQEPFFMSKYGIKTIVKDGDYKLKFCIRKPGVKVNAIAEYDVGADEYNVEGWTIDGIDFWRSYNVEGICWDTLIEHLDGCLRAGLDKTQKPLAAAILESPVILDDHR